MDNVEGIVCLEVKKKIRGEDGVIMLFENVMLGSMYYVVMIVIILMRDLVCIIVENRNLL